MRAQMLEIGPEFGPIDHVASYHEGKIGQRQLAQHMIDRRRERGRRDGQMQRPTNKPLGVGSSTP